MPNSEDFAPTLILGAPPQQPPQPPISSSRPQPAAERYLEPQRFSFTGTGSEYFRIWIVNLLLTILTLGIYSAWAKVRKQRYFYGSTHVAGSNFEYHGNPIAILKGRIIAVGLLIAYNFAPKISMWAGFAMVALMGVIMPALIWKSLQFKTRNSSYRGIRFGFAGTMFEAYMTYLIWPAISAFTLNLLAPFVHQRMKKFQHEESRFGTSHFTFNAPIKGFYGAYLISIGVVILGLLWIVPSVGALVTSIYKSGGRKTSSFVTAFLLAAGIFAWGHVVYSIFISKLQNLIWSNTKLEEHDFVSDMDWKATAIISLTNVLGIIFTLGLYTPFAKMRMMKYRVESVTLVPHGNIDDFFAGTDTEVAAIGEGVVDLLDFDFAL